MKLVCLILAILLVNYSYAQQKGRRLFLGFTISPDMAYRSLNSDNSGLRSLRNELEKPMFAYTGGITLTRRFDQRVQFNTGVLYSKKGFRTKRYELDPGSPTPDPALPKTVKHIFTFHYIDIPLKADLVWGKGKSRFITGAGITANILLNDTHKTEWENNNGTTTVFESSLDTQRKLNISPTISVGLQQQVSERVYLLLEPSFRYGLLKLSDAPAGEHLWNLGVFASVRYTLSRI